MNIYTAIEIANSGDEDMTALLKAFCYERMPGLLKAAKAHKEECHWFGPKLTDLAAEIAACEEVPTVQE